MLFHSSKEFSVGCTICVDFFQFFPSSRHIRFSEKFFCCELMHSSKSHNFAQWDAFHRSKLFWKYSRSCWETRRGSLFCSGIHSFSIMLSEFLFGHNGSMFVARMFVILISLLSSAFLLFVTISVIVSTIFILLYGMYDLLRFSTSLIWKLFCCVSFLS